MKESSKTNNVHWLHIAENIAVVASIGGSIASIFLKESFFMATIPLSASVTLNLLNRQRLSDFIDSTIVQEQKAIATLIDQVKTIQTQSKDQDQDNQSNISKLSQELKQIKNATTILARLQKQEKQNSENTAKELDKLENSLTELNHFSEKLEKNLSSVESKQKESNRVLRELKAIDVFSQNIQLDPNSAQSYFERGFSYQRLGNKHRAIEDYTKAIELSSYHAQAYYHRGLLYAELNNNQKAVIDLRKSSQLYFDKGNLDKYRETRDLSQQLHQKHNVEENIVIHQSSEEKVIVSNLFA